MKDRFAVSMFGQKRLSREGGIEIVVKELCTRMARDGCQVTCYNRSGHHVSGAEYDNKIEYDGIRQKFVPTIERKGLAAVSSSFFAALYSAFGKYDVVHIHAEGPAFFSWLPKMFGKRVVVTIHGIDWQREKWKSGFGSKFIRQGEKNAVKYADEIIVLSKGVQDYFRDTYGRETHFIPNGVNRPKTREAGLITEKFGLTKDSYILFLGRLVPEKGIRYLVEAFKDVKTDKKLVIAGGSSDTDSFMMELKELAKDDNRIIFTGFVQGQMLDELYSNAYIYTLPSDLEGMLFANFITNVLHESADLNYRTAIWQIVMAKIAESPVIGHGLNMGNVSFAIGQGIAGINQATHNGILYFVFSSGIIGTVYILGICFLLLRKTNQRTAAGRVFCAMMICFSTLWITEQLKLYNTSF